MPGYDIADNIVQAIEDSSKVLLILSPTFLESDWCQFEVRMARQKLTRDRRDSVVFWRRFGYLQTAGCPRRSYATETNPHLGEKDTRGMDIG